MLREDEMSKRYLGVLAELEREHRRRVRAIRRGFLIRVGVVLVVGVLAMVWQVLEGNLVVRLFVTP